MLTFEFIRNLTYAGGIVAIVTGLYTIRIAIKVYKQEKRAKNS